jgi:hypothetical protein
VSGRREAWTIRLICATAVAAALPAASPAAQVGGGLPDLDQRAPYDISVVPEAGTFRLVFASAVDNVGAGPLIIVGRRASRQVEGMRADQVLVRADGSRKVRARVGILRFVVSPDHRHWHYLRFDTYEFRRADAFGIVLRDKKTGFCLGDRYPIDSEAALSPVYTSRCGLNATRLLRLEEGISPGFGDDYDPDLEGQHFDITGLEAGRYLLVHRANADRSLLESDYSNNAASVLIRLTWRVDGPTVTVLKTCPNTARCPA